MAAQNGSIPLKISFGNESRRAYEFEKGGCESGRWGNSSWKDKTG
jgi:hypothetical protein